jgi:tetratricopeptide (TPR) repeat protein
LGEVKISGIQRSVALAVSLCMAGTVVSLDELSPLKLLAPAIAAESKWSIENVLKARDIEIDAKNEVTSDICSSAVDRELAEMELTRGYYKNAVKVSQTVINDLRKYLKPDDARVQSARLLLSEAYLKSKNRNGCLKHLRAVLLQQLHSDEIRELKIRRGMSASELKEDGVETESQFEERYNKLASNAVFQPASEAVRRAELLFWENRLADALRLTRISLSLDDTGTVDGDRTKFLQALIYFGQGDRGALELTRRRLAEGSSNSMKSDHNGQATENKTRTYIKESQASAGAMDARKAFVDGLVAELDGEHTEALKSYETAIAKLKGQEPRLDALVFQIYKGNALLNNGEPVAAYRNLNHVFETARRLVEGREQGLLFGKMSQVALTEMYRTLLVRMTYESELSEANDSDSQPSKVLRNCLEASMFDGKARKAVRPYEENYAALADALYHVGYQFKTSHRQTQAQRCFWDNVFVIETHLPEYKRQLGGTLYDLAESYFWSEHYDLAIEVFRKCVDVRRRIDPDSLDYILTLNTLGRVYLAKGDALEAIDCVNSALHRLLHHEKLQSTRVSRMVADLRRTSKVEEESSAPEVVASGDRYIEQISALPLPEQIDSVSKSRSSANPDTYPQIDDLWQVLADSYSRHKNYDEAVEISKRLLELRESSKVRSQSDILGSLWQLAYICGVSNRHKDADKYYSELLDKFGTDNPRWRALWLYSRGVVLDSLGLPERAASDFRKSIVEYKKYMKTLDKINDSESVDQTGWMIADLEQELKAKQRCKPDATDYLKGYATCYWDKKRFPLKVYIDDSRERGFGPKLFALVKKAVDDWAETPGMKDKIKFVDDREDADIYLERVSNYDAIPYGSGGGASASFVWRGKKLTKEIDKVHLRMYCADYDLDKMANHAVLQLYTLALHEFGHGLGLGHSPSGLDVMYWKSAIDRLSSRDRASVRGIYGFQEGGRGR